LSGSLHSPENPTRRDDELEYPLPFLRKVEAAATSDADRVLEGVLRTESQRGLWRNQTVLKLL
jgi:hypothetical protein